MTTPRRGPYELLNNYPRLRRPPKPHPRFDWPDEAKTMLRSLWAGKVAAAEIADKISMAFDYKTTKNMVIGMAARLNLESHQRSSHIPRPSTRPRKPKPPSTRKPQTLTIRAGKSIAAHVVTECSEVRDLPPEIPSAERKTILELTNETCRWPIGDPGKPGFCFCGMPEAGLEQKRPYCNAHARMAAARRLRSGSHNYHRVHWLLHGENDADFR